MRSEEYSNWNEEHTRKNQDQLDEAEDWVSDLEDKVIEYIQSEQQKGKGFFKNEDSLRSLWDNLKHSNIFIIGVWKEERENKEL